jgi:hypothetical protein
VAVSKANGDGLPESFFDYESVPAESRAELQTIVTRVRAGQRRHIEAVAEIGKDLLRAKELLGHGNFTSWLQAEFRWAERTARNYMAVAEHFSGKTAIFADLDLGTAYALAAKSTPAAVRENVASRLDAGERLTAEDIRADIDRAKRVEAEARKEARTTPEQKKAAQRRKKAAQRREARRNAEWERERNEEDAKLERERVAGEKAAERLRELLTGEQRAEIVGLLKDASLYAFRERLRQ